MIRTFSDFQGVVTVDFLRYLIQITITFFEDLPMFPDFLVKSYDFLDFLQIPASDFWFSSNTCQWFLLLLKNPLSIADFLRKPTANSLFSSKTCRKNRRWRGKIVFARHSKRGKIFEKAQEDEYVSLKLGSKKLLHCTSVREKIPLRNGPCYVLLVFIFTVRQTLKH